MERRALDYLEAQLKLYIASPGNDAEVARILRALKEFSRDEPAPKSDGRSALQGQFRFGSGVEDQREEPPVEPDEGSD
jgi:hypothetical protein